MQSRQGGRGEIRAASFDGVGRWMAALRTSPEDVLAASISLWAAESYQPIEKPLRAGLDGSMPAWGTLAVSADGRLLAAGASPDDVFLWSLDPGDSGPRHGLAATVHREAPRRWFRSTPRIGRCRPSI